VASKTVTRADIVEKLVVEVGLSRTECQDMLEAVLETLIVAMERGEGAKLSRFGNFTVRAKRARVGRNPKTGVEAEIAPRRVATFKPSQILREQVDAGAL
jgi:integration host factor subunit alpha